MNEFRVQSELPIRHESRRWRYGDFFYIAPDANSKWRGVGEAMASNRGGSATYYNLAKDGRPVLALWLHEAQWNPLQAAYASIRESAYRSLALQTRLYDLLELVQTTTDAKGTESTDTSLLDRELQRRIAADPVAGLGDLLDLNKYAGMDLLRKGWALMENFDSLVRSLPVTPEVTALLTEFRVSVDAQGNIDYNAESIAVGGDGRQSLYGGNASDRVYAGAGDDNLNGGGGHNVLVGVEMLTYPHSVRRSKEGRRWEHGDTTKPISNSAWRLSA